MLQRRTLNYLLSLPGRKFDKNGELIEKRTHWSEPAIKMFQERAKCLVEQFSRYKVLNKFHVSTKQDCYSFLASPLSSAWTFTILTANGQSENYIELSRDVAATTIHQVS